MSESLAKVADALAFAAERHSTQRRKDAAASPYINHPIAVMRVLAIEAGIGDPDILCAALLHDTIEDTATTALELGQRFGERVTAIVVALTDDKALPRQERKERQVRHAPDLSREAAWVKLADKICNLRDIASSPPRDWTLERRREYFDWARRVVDGLRGAHAGLESEFDRAYALRP
jgi:GTP diphosphokinase / guanosine-3',5'-bis(diphosphate) 3'-diphosphatase